MNVDPKEALRKAFLAGHGIEQGLTLADAERLDVNSPEARRVWESWRASDANYDFLLQHLHGRSDPLDDTYGPATEILTTLSRCPLPDKPIPEDFDLDAMGFDNPETRSVWERLRGVEFAGSQWPKGCVSPGSHASELDYSDRYCICIYLDTTSISTSWRNHLNTVIETNLGLYSDIGLVVRYYVDGKPYDKRGKDLMPKQCEIHKVFGNIPGGVIGWNEFPQNTCKVTIDGKLDSSWNVSLDGHIMLEMHETGHGVGEAHTRGGPMNPSILFGLPYTWRNTPSYHSISSSYGGIKVSTVPLEEDEPPPDPKDFPPAQGVFFWQGKSHDFVIDNIEDIALPNGIFNWQGELLGIKVTSSKEMFK